MGLEDSTSNFVIEKVSKAGVGEKNLIIDSKTGEVSVPGGLDVTKELRIGL